MESPERLTAAERRWVRACLRAAGVNLSDLDDRAMMDAFWILAKLQKQPSLEGFRAARMKGG